MLQHHLRAKLSDELTKIISLQGEEYAVDGVNGAIHPQEGAMLSIER